MARFIISKYERDDGTIAPIKIKAGTITTWNTVPEGNRVGEYARVSGSSRSYGTVARKVTLSRAVGGDTAFGSATVSVQVVVLSKDIFAGLADGTTVAYGSLTDWKVSGQKGESRK
jgi:hypothetical protein